MTDWRPDLVKMVLDKLVPDNVYVTVIAQKFAEVATQVRTYIFWDSVSDFQISFCKPLNPGAYQVAGGGVPSDKNLA